MEDKNKAQELYLKEIGCNLDPLQLEVLFMILDYASKESKEKSIPRKFFIPNLRNFSGIPIDEKEPDDLKKMDDLLNILCTKGYIDQEEILDNVVLTEKATDMIEQLIKKPKFWRSFSPKRWRQVILKKNGRPKTEDISINETKIIRELIQKDKILISYVLKKYSVDLPELKTMEKRKRISVNHLKNSVRKGARFIEGLAESFRRIETTHDLARLEEWRNEVKTLFSAQEQDVSKLWEERYANAYILAKKTVTCPIGLPTDCINKFKDDTDNITPAKQLSIREMDLKINIKTGFGYVDDKRTRHVFNTLVIEFIQRHEGDRSVPVRFSGIRSEMVELFENIKAEAKKMSEETKIKLEDGRKERVTVTSYREKIIINIEVLISTKSEKITAVFFNDLDRIIEDIKNCPIEETTPDQTIDQALSQNNVNSG